MCICTHIHRYTYTYIHTDIYAHTHTDIDRVPRDPTSTRRDQVSVKEVPTTCTVPPKRRPPVPPRLD